MNIPPSQQLWIYITESDTHRGRSTAMQIIEALREAGCPGATVLRGVAGYGGHHVLHSELAIEVASHLPLVITVIDHAERIAQVLPTLRALVHDGMITITPVEVVHVCHRERDPFPRHLMVGDVMSRAVVSVYPDDSLSTIVSLLIERRLRALPVIDNERRVVGIITDGDLLNRGTQGLSVRLQRCLPLTMQMTEATDLETHPQTAADLMTPNPETLPEQMPLAQAATVMSGHDRKRMPVVGPGGVLVGMVSRYDLLKTVAEGMRQHPEEAIHLPEGAPATIADLMITTSATVLTDAPVVEVLNALMLSPLRRVVVLDSNHTVQGIITDGDVLRRASRRMQPSALGRLVAWLSVSKAPAAIQVEGYDRMASEIMSCPAITIRADASVAEGVRLMMAHKVKSLPVINAYGAFVGMVNRSGLLAALSSPNSF
ncbi:DUF190 domain-containing protein [Candidatus Oscillochloris fontis]|uniref:DUF190 domain-containing protein n=1 Tax=Candidatus Oscillochloris fontis TaxID=2496868 RepID=UPI00101E16D4|nr:DUF190 domain-containing protein [Candidatus Oscillochloris fontis]